MNDDYDSDILRFYRLEGGNHVGDRLDEILTWDHERLEEDHDYIQWVFPSNEPSQMNSEAPTMTREDSEVFRDDPVLRGRMYRSFELILDFFGFELAEGETPQIRLMEGTDRRTNPQGALGAFNHNMLRVTRILKSLRLAGMDSYARAWLGALSPWKNSMSWSHWQRATHDPLWDEVAP